MDSKNLIENIKKELNLPTDNIDIVNYGKVISVLDGVVNLSGLSDAALFEKIYCEEKDTYAVILNLGEDIVGAVVLGDFTKIKENDRFRTTGEILSVKASEKMTGRVIDALGDPIDGKELVLNSTNSKLMPIEKIAPGVTEREPVNEPLQTGVIAVDTMIPIGRGQRELIIGDRGTGKTAIAVDSIINQKQTEKPVICIYVGIGQKASRISALKQTLTEYGAMEHTIILSASASDPVTMQYIAPYTATAIAEYFLEQGKDSLVIYDDLTKHAWAYRQISLTLRRPPGREAYPGDIFYLHSRLLERSCKLNEKNGKGSITSLPIVETQFGDVSAYIPTNIISITDGQIYLDSNLFNSGIRPAIDVSNSVSRVGGSAQLKEMKQVAGSLRLQIASFKELEAFSQFGSGDLDVDTKQKLERGQKIIEILKQPRYKPRKATTQIALIKAFNDGLFDKVALEDVQTVEEKFIGFIENTDSPKKAETQMENFLKTYKNGDAE